MQNSLIIVNKTQQFNGEPGNFVPEFYQNQAEYQIENENEDDYFLYLNSYQRDDLMNNQDDQIVSQKRPKNSNKLYNEQHQNNQIQAEHLSTFHQQNNETSPEYKSTENQQMKDQNNGQIDSPMFESIDKQGNLGFNLFQQTQNRQTSLEQLSFENQQMNDQINCQSDNHIISYDKFKNSTQQLCVYHRNYETQHQSQFTNLENPYIEQNNGQFGIQRNDQRFNQSSQLHNSSQSVNGYNPQQFEYVLNQNPYIEQNNGQFGIQRNDQRFNPQSQRQNSSQPVNDYKIQQSEYLLSQNPWIEQNNGQFGIQRNDQRLNPQSQCQNSSQPVNHYNVQQFEYVLHQNPYIIENNGQFGIQRNDQIFNPQFQLHNSSQPVNDNNVQQSEHILPQNPNIEQNNDQFSNQRQYQMIIPQSQLSNSSQNVKGKIYIQQFCGQNKIKDENFDEQTQNNQNSSFYTSATDPQADEHYQRYKRSYLKYIPQLLCTAFKFKQEKQNDKSFSSQFQFRIVQAIIMNKIGEENVKKSKEFQEIEKNFGNRFNFIQEQLPSLLSKGDFNKQVVKRIDFIYNKIYNEINDDKYQNKSKQEMQSNLDQYKQKMKDKKENRKKTENRIEGKKPQRNKPNYKFQEKKPKNK